MIGTPLRALLFATAVSIGTLAVIRDAGAVAGMAFTVAFLLLTTWIRYGGVMAAGRHFRAGRRDAAWAELSRVPFGGRLLASGVRPYFHLLRAAILIDRERWEDVSRECRAVLAMEKTKAANHATAHGALSKALVMLGRRDEAAEHLRLARSMPHKPALDKLLADVDESIATADP